NMTPGPRRQSRRTRIGRSPPARRRPSVRNRGYGRRSAERLIGPAPVPARARERNGRSLQSYDPTFHELSPSPALMGGGGGLPTPERLLPPLLGGSEWGSYRRSPNAAPAACETPPVPPEDGADEALPAPFFSYSSFQCPCFFRASATSLGM